MRSSTECARRTGDRVVGRPFSPLTCRTLIDTAGRRPPGATARLALGFGLALECLVLAGLYGCSIMPWFDGDEDDPSDPVCGNGVIETGEECDVGDVDGATCAERVPGSSGEPTCNAATCRLDLSSCAICGDGIRQPGEDCDGVDLGGWTCKMWMDDATGQLACDPLDCTYDWRGCSRCGDGIIMANEACDGSDLGSRVCADVVPGSSGTLACDPSTCQYDTSGCTL